MVRRPAEDMRNGSALGTPADNPAATRAPDPATSRPEPDCELCHGQGYFRWTQMCLDGVLRELEHPCIHGCGGELAHPADRSYQVVDVLDAPAVDSL
jgi:hypothetical protein